MKEIKDKINNQVIKRKSLKDTCESKSKKSKSFELNEIEVDLEK